MNRDELDQERPVPAAPRPRKSFGRKPQPTPSSERWRPDTQSSPLADELSSIFGGANERMIRRHLTAAGKRMREQNLLTDAEKAALRANGLGHLIGDPA